MTLEPSGLGPSGDVALLAAMLRADRADVASYARVLTGTLAGALPEGMVEVEQRRGLADRMADGTGARSPSSCTGWTGSWSCVRGRAGVEAQVRQVVRGVVISRKAVGIDEWLRALAEDLTRIAARDAAARAALERFLGG